MKSRMDRKFSRIENLWPRDGSCPLPLRSKRIDRVCEAQRSNESPSGAFKWQSGLAQARWRGIAPTSSVGFAIKGIMDCGERQDGFANFIAVKR